MASAARLGGMDTTGMREVGLGRPLAQPWTMADARLHHQLTSRVARKRAHGWLRQLRLQASDGAQVVEEAVDLTDDQAYDWRGYVANHPQCEDIVGPGIIHFEFRFINSVEHNTESQGHDLPVYRADFIAHRVDGSAARVHPSSSQEAQVVVGTLAQWRLAGVHAPQDMASRVRALAETQGTTMWFGHSQADKMHARMARSWLRAYLDEWSHRPHPRGPFYLNVTTTASPRPFPWWLLCIGETWAHGFERVGVNTWAVCWNNRLQEPGFHIVLKDDTSYTMRVGAMNFMSPGQEDVCFL